MRGLLSNRLVLAGVVVIAIAALAAIATVVHPVSFASGSAAPGSARAQVTSVVRACAAPGSTGSTAGGVALAATEAGTGSATISRLATTSSVTPSPALRVISAAGRLTQVPVKPAPAVKAPAGKNTSGNVPSGPVRGGVMVQATGAMARGLEIEQTNAAGQSSARCGQPGTDFWFVGPGASKVANISLYLMDTDSQAATAEIDVFTDSGPMLGSTDTGVAVPAHGMVVQSLAKLVKNSRVMALHITTSVGRVAAAVRDTSSKTAAGGWLPVAQAPAKSVVLPGLPSSAGTRELDVVVPGSGNAQLKVTAVTAKGSYQPTGGSGIDLPGGSAVQVALPSLGGVAAAVRLTSNVPVTATMSVPGGATGSPGALTAAAAPILQQSVVAGNTGTSASLVLSAPRAAAQVKVATQTTGAPTAGTVVQIAAGKTMVVKLKAPPGTGRTKPFAAIITPQAGSGPVYGGRVVTIASKIRSILPLDSSLTWVMLPAVRDSQAATQP